MQTVWFPIPVAALFRRIVNVVGTLSISHHYLQQPPVDPSEPRRPSTFQALQWPAWLPKDQRSWRLSLAEVLGAQAVSYGDDAKEPPRRTVSPSRPRRNDHIHKLISNPTLCEPVRTPRNPIVLCHGLYGFDVRGPSSFPILQHHYWSNVLNVLRGKVGAEVLVTSVPSTGSISSRAQNLDHFLREQAPGRGINFLAHSMGGLDCRHLISHIKPADYTPLSLTTIATPHRGSPFMDWCRQYIGLGRHKVDYPGRYHQEDTSLSSAADTNGSPPKSESKSIPGVKSLLSLASLPSSFTTLLLSLLDSPAYAHLTSTYLNTIFNPATPNDPSVKYFSVAGRTSGMSIWHPLWLPKMVLDGFEEKERARMRDEGHPLADMDAEWGNDGLVTIQSARWGEFLGVLEECDHWQMRGARGLDVDLPSIPTPDEWNLTDWGKFVRAWKKEEKKAAKSAGAGISDQRHGEAVAAAAAAKRAEEGQGQRDVRSARERERDSANADEVVQNSTEKLSMVFDWIVDQAPGTPEVGALTSSAVQQTPSSVAKPASVDSDPEEPEDAPKDARRCDLETKQDLERFYVALCRKLYDEGL
ncbi:alpha/beta-hydrolase [Lenzites betulinus]|nr:alpha/beta-hydrolase [Lenzites betulinus]